MAINTSLDVPREAEADPFAEGWLLDQLGKVVGELAQRPPVQQPRLTGGRAATMQGPAWLRASRA